MSEWFKVTTSKVVVGEIPPRVRIPSSPFLLLNTDLKKSKPYISFKFIIEDFGFSSFGFSIGLNISYKHEVKVVFPSNLHS